MISPTEFLRVLADHGFGPLVGVPCSFLKPLINCAIQSPEFEYLSANNEGEAVAIACGAYLTGRRPVVMFQNSGLGNAVNPLTSLASVFQIPLLLITTWRGEPGLNDAPQHELMGAITPALLELLEIKNEVFPETDSQMAASINRAHGHLDAVRLPFAFVMRRDAVDRYDLDAPPARESRPFEPTLLPPEPVSQDLMLRREALLAVADTVDEDTVLIATTGKTARELSAHRDRTGNFYVIGSMGCATSLALGVALYSDRKVVVLDGDGAALMRLEAMVSVGHYRPPNLVHVILDNQVHESTGGQRTHSDGVDFAKVAAACGYATATSRSSREGLLHGLGEANASGGPHLIHLRIRPGTDPNLGRPELSPPELADRFRQAICGDETICV